ncbi:MAG: type II CAAX endopeptidase family protein [Candidatus Zixiibacteriota bacterium]
MSENLIQSQFSQVSVESTLEKIIQFPLSRLIIAILFIIPPALIVMSIDLMVPSDISNNLEKYITDFKSLVFFILLYIFYKFYLILVEKRKNSEMSFNKCGRELFAGLAIGAGLLLTVVSVLAILGYFKIDVFGNDYASLWHGFFTFGSAAFFEEIFFRLIVFKLTEELLGSWTALVIQAILFGLAHFGNPGADIISTVSIMLSAGLMLTVIFMYTRRIWLILGLHFIWNYLQASIFGIPVSGNKVAGLLESSLSGPELLSGGNFGVEASILTVIFCLIVWAYYMRKVILAKNYIQPLWKREALSIEVSDIADY